MSKNYREQLNTILDALAESVVESSDECIREEAQEEGTNLDAVAYEVKHVLHDAVRCFGEKRRRAVREQYESHVTSMNQRKRVLPSTYAQLLSLLEAVFTQRPDLQNVLTLQYRDFREMSQEDVESSLIQLYELGVLNGDEDDCL
jgi:hypothetical protein